MFWFSRLTSSLHASSPSTTHHFFFRSFITPWEFLNIFLSKKLFRDLFNEPYNPLGDCGRVRGVLGHRDRVALAVQQTAKLPQVALPLRQNLETCAGLRQVHLNVVLDGGGLHEEGVEPVLLAHSVDSRRIAGGVDAWLRALHERVHLLVSRDRRALSEDMWL